MIKGLATDHNTAHNTAGINDSNPQNILSTEAKQNHHQHQRNPRINTLARARHHTVFASPESLLPLKAHIQTRVQLLDGAALEPLPEKSIKELIKKKEIIAPNTKPVRLFKALRALIRSGVADDWKKDEAFDFGSISPKENACGDELDLNSEQLNLLLEQGEFVLLSAPSEPKAKVLLKESLLEGGYSYIDNSLANSSVAYSLMGLKGHWGDITEDSFLVFTNQPDSHLSPIDGFYSDNTQHLLKLSQKFGQDSLIYRNAGVQMLIQTIGDRTTTYLGEGEVIKNTPFEGDYSEVPNAQSYFQLRFADHPFESPEAAFEAAARLHQKLDEGVYLAGETIDVPKFQEDRVMVFFRGKGTLEASMEMRALLKAHGEQSVQIVSTDHHIDKAEALLGKSAPWVKKKEQFIDFNNQAFKALSDAKIRVIIHDDLNKWIDIMAEIERLINGKPWDVSVEEMAGSTFGQGSNLSSNMSSNLAKSQKEHLPVEQPAPGDYRIILVDCGKTLQGGHFSFSKRHELESEGREQENLKFGALNVKQYALKDFFKILDTQLRDTGRFDFKAISDGFSLDNSKPQEPLEQKTLQPVKTSAQHQAQSTEKTSIPKLGGEVKEVTLFRPVPGAIMGGSVRFNGQMPDVKIDQAFFDKYVKLANQRLMRTGKIHSGESLSAAEIEGKAINVLMQMVHETFKDFRYDQIHGITNSVIDQEGVEAMMTMTEFAEKKWGDCRQHNIALAIMMQAIGIEDVCVVNQTVGCSTDESQTEDHTMVRYRSKDGNYYIADAFFPMYDGLQIPELEGELKVKLTDGVNPFTAPGRDNIYPFEHMTARGNLEKMKAAGRGNLLTHSDMFREGVTIQVSKPLPYPIYKLIELVKKAATILA